MGNLPDWLLSPELIWFVIGLVLLLLELAGPGFFIFFFGVGAWVTSLLCVIFNVSLTVQLLVFVASSIMLLVLLRSRLKNLLFSDSAKYSQLSDTFDDYVGKKVTVVREIAPDVIGKVELNGTLWNAESDETIPEGSIVVIVDKENITLKVMPLPR